MKEIKYTNKRRNKDDFELANISIVLEDDGIAIHIGAKKSTKDFFESENKEEYFNEYFKEISQIVLKVTEEINESTEKLLFKSFAEEFLNEMDA